MAAFLQAWKSATAAAGNSAMEEAFGEADITSAAMRAALNDWYSLYYDTEGPAAEDRSMRLPLTITTKLVRTVFGEYNAAMKGEREQEHRLQQVLDALDEVKETALQMAAIGGECLLKPVVNGDGFAFMVIGRMDYSVLARDELGRATAYGTTEVTRVGGKQYTLAEKRACLPDGRLRIESKLYCAEGSRAGLGRQVPLGSLAKYAALAPEVVLEEPVGGTGLVLLKMPFVNCVDGSEDGVSIYAPAAATIHRLYEHEQRLRREYEKAESRIVASGDVLAEDELGRKRLVDDLFLALDDDPANVGVTVYSPEIRHESYLERKNDYLRMVENQVGIKRGSLSAVESMERTATEVASSEGDYNLTILHLQNAWRQAVVQALHTCDALGRMYLGWSPAHWLEPVVDFGDGVLFNRDKVWQEYERMVQNGWLKPELALAWYFDMPAETPEELEKVRGMMPTGGQGEKELADAQAMG